MKYTTRERIDIHKKSIERLEKDVSEINDREKSLVSGFALTILANHRIFLDIYERIAALEEKK